MSLFGNIAEAAREVVGSHDLGEAGVAVGEGVAAELRALADAEQEASGPGAILRDIGSSVKDVGDKMMEASRSAIEGLDGSFEADMIVAEPVDTVDHGAEAYAGGDDIHFAEPADVGIVGHETAHVVQASAVEADHTDIVAAPADAPAELHEEQQAEADGDETE